MGSGLTTSQLHRLDRACIDLQRSFDTGKTYLVGSAFDGREFHDVDVRTILADEEFDAIFATRKGLWGSFCLAVSVHLSITTGLTIDYQVQRRTEANEKHGDKPRNPLGITDVRHFGRDFAGGGDATAWAVPRTPRCESCGMVKLGEDHKCGPSAADASAVSVATEREEGEGT